MHVCLLSLEWPPYGGGIGSYMFNLARGLSSLKHLVTVITHDQNPVACPGVRVVPVPLPDCRRTIPQRVRRAARRFLRGIEHPWSWDAHRAFRRVMETDPVDIIETAEFGAWGWHFLGAANIPVAVRCHNPAHVVWSVNHVHTESWAMPRTLRKQDRLEREQTYASHGIASPSHVLAHHLSLQWVIPMSRFTVIPNPIDTELFCPGEADADRNEILYVGRLEYNKGAYDLAEAATPLLEEVGNVRLRFVGMDRPASPRFSSTGQTASQVLRSMIPSRFHDRLVFTSHVPVTEIIQLQRQALVSVMPTRGFESFSYTALEAMACGTPVVATECGGPSEIITDGVDGLLVPPGKPAALTEAVRRLLSDSTLRSRLGARGRQTAEERFSNSVILPRIVQWYAETIGRFREGVCRT